MSKYEKLQAIIDLAEEAQQIIDDEDSVSLMGILKDLFQATAELRELTR